MKTMGVQVNGLRNKENYKVFVFIIEVAARKVVEVVEKSTLAVVDTLNCTFKT